MYQASMIQETLSQISEQDTNQVLSKDFFNELHLLQMKYIKLKHSKKTKSNEHQLTQIILQLVSNYTDCIDHFQSRGENISVYYQSKIKELNKYYGHFIQISTIASPSPQTERVMVSDYLTSSKDLGSISEQTQGDFLPEEEERQLTGTPKQHINKKVIACLQNQDIQTHLIQNEKKIEKRNQYIANCVKFQNQSLEKRLQKKRGHIRKKRLTQSFSEAFTLNFEFKKKNQTIPQILINQQQIEVLFINDPQSSEQEQNQQQRIRKIMQNDQNDKLMEMLRLPLRQNQEKVYQE